MLEPLEDRCLLSFTVVDLGGFSPVALNNASQIAGTLNNHAALWQNGVALDLGTLGGTSSNGYDVNDAGQVVGKAQTSSAYQAFQWAAASGMQDLGVTGNYTAAYGVNASGQVIGTIGGDYSLTPHAFLWDASTGMHDLGTFGSNGSQARALNETGQVVGWRQTLLQTGMGVYFTETHGYIYDSVTTNTTLLGALPGDSASRAIGINDQGQVIGTSGHVNSALRGSSFVGREAFLWQGGQMIDLGLPTASAINNLGQVVGGKYLWTNGTLTDLNSLIDPSSGWVITGTTDINDAGQIVGQGTLNGLTHNVLLNPPDSSGTVSFGLSGFPSVTIAGATGSLTVTALNSSGNTVSGYTGTVQFTSSDPQAGVPSAYTFTAADAGVHTFNAMLNTAGTQSIWARDPTGSITGTESGITVQAASFSKLAVTSFPMHIIAGVPGSFTVTAEDANGNPVNDYTGTIHFSSSDPQAALPGDYTFSNNTVQSFVTTLKTAGTQSITATDIVMASLTAGQSSIQVTPAAAVRLRLTGPSSVTAGTAFSITIIAYDVYGNVATDYSGAVAFKSSDARATLPSKYTFTAADNGAHTFTGLKLMKKGHQTITVTDTLNASLTVTLTLNVI
jgi:probable HAF family extracellular repeat protein